MAQIYKQFDAGVIKILLLFPIWNLKAILTKYYFSSQMTKEEKNHKEKDFTLKKKALLWLRPSRNFGTW